MTTSKVIAAMSSREVIDALQSGDALAQVRQILSSHAARMEQAAMQQQLGDPVEWRREELQAANRICAIFGTGLE
jgi:hypothetical protein